jgi:hypothetical protein
MPSTEALIEKRARQAAEGVEAWNAYPPEEKHINENMFRLRAIRLATEAARANEPKPTKPAKKKKA